MNVTREVILDLMPLYASGEASQATRDLVDEYLKTDPELAERVRALGPQGFPRDAPALPPELELRSLGRTRRLLSLQRWLFALAITFTALSLTSEITFHGGGIRQFRLLIIDYPLQFGTCLAVAIGCWAGYHAVRRRLRTTAL